MPVTTSYASKVSDVPMVEGGVKIALWLRIIEQEKGREEQGWETWWFMDIDPISNNNE